MNRKGKNVKLLSVGAGILFFSVLIMIIVALMILGNLTSRVLPNAAGYAVIAAIVIHLLIFAGVLKVIRENKRSFKNRRAEYIGLGVLLIIFGLVYMDGAFAYWGDKGTLTLSILMFISTLCDFVAAIITISVFFFKPKRSNKNTFTHPHNP